MESKPVSLAEAIFRKKPLEITRRNAAAKSLDSVGTPNRSKARSEVKARMINAIPSKAVASSVTASHVARPSEVKVSRPLSARVVYSKGTNTLKTSSISPRLSSSFSTDGSLSLKDVIKTSSKPKHKIDKLSSNNSIVIASDYENKISTLKHIILLRYILANRNREENSQTHTDLLAAWQLVYDAEEEASALSTREILANELISIHHKLCSL